MTKKELRLILDKGWSERREKIKTQREKAALAVQKSRAKSLEKKGQ